MGRPVAASQSRAVRSLPPVMKILPSGLNATASTGPSRCRTVRKGSPAAASQSRAVLSPPPVTTVLPSGLKAAATTGTGWERTALSRAW